MGDAGKLPIGVVGAGTMGAGIAQVAAAKGHTVVLHDTNAAQLTKAQAQIESGLKKDEEKGRLPAGGAAAALARIEFAQEIKSFASCGFVIEAVIEDLAVKQELFHRVEELVSEGAILATNTSSLSVASIGANCKHPERVIGVHFFNPATLMQLVEIVPSLMTAPQVTQSARALVDSWGKVTVLAKDTPGFIVNRIARPFYGEALRILEEGIADCATIDWAMKELGGFKMGPFELMDLIGNDINFKVTCSVFEAFFYDPRYRPALTQQRMVEAKRYGKKSGRGYYDYSQGAALPAPAKDKGLGEQVFMRILAMLINEAADALLLKVATVKDIELSMTKGVNYPKGLLAWADELGVSKVLSVLEGLQAEYGEDRYRPSALLRRLAHGKKRFADLAEGA